MTNDIRVDPALRLIMPVEPGGKFWHHHPAGEFWCPQLLFLVIACWGKQLHQHPGLGLRGSDSDASKLYHAITPERMPFRRSFFTNLNPE